VAPASRQVALRSDDGQLRLDRRARGADPRVAACQRRRRLRVEGRGQEAVELCGTIDGKDHPHHRWIAAENGREAPGVERAPEPVDGICFSCIGFSGN
jgi:hypothetical protein